MHPPKKEVSILVVMESAQEGRWSFSDLVMWLVSILVVMESAQEVRAANVKELRTWGFNPCCNGKCSGSVYVSAHHSAELQVSILVVMESAQEECAKDQKNKDYNWFQSLL